MNSLESFRRDSFKIHLRVADQIGLAVVRGEFAPGDLLPPEAKFCEALGVSRTAVREAIRGLVAKGLLTSKAKLGTRVRDPQYWSHMDPDVLRWRLAVSDTASYLHKMFELRRAVEPAAAAIAAANAEPVDHERISANFEAMVAAGRDDDAWVGADLLFHKSIYLATHNEFFWPIGQLFELGLKEMFTIAARGSHRARAIVEHRALMDAILAGKPDLARAATNTLLGNAEDDIRLIRSSLDSLARAV